LRVRRRRQPVLVAGQPGQQARLRSVGHHRGRRRFGHRRAGHDRVRRGLRTWHPEGRRRLRQPQELPRVRRRDLPGHERGRVLQASVEDLGRRRDRRGAARHRHGARARGRCVHRRGGGAGAVDADQRRLGRRGHRQRRARGSHRSDRPVPVRLPWAPGHVQAEGPRPALVVDDSQQLNAQDVRPAAGGGLGDLQLHRLDRSEDIDALKQWLGERRDFLAVDIETTGLNVGHDYIRLVQFGDSRHGWAIDYKDWRGVVKEVIEGYDRPMVAHNLLFDSRMLKQDGIDIPQRLAHDTMVMGHLLDPSARMDLKGLATMYVDRRAQIGQGLLRQTMQQHGWTWATVPTDVPAYWTYSALDTCLTSMLADKVFGTVHSSYREAYELEMAVIHCLREAEIAGLLIDETYRQQRIEKLEQDAAVLRAQIPAENPASDRQIIDMLHAQGAVWAAFTEKGNLSVDKDVLDMLAEHGYPVAGIVRRWRTARRLLDNY